MPSSRDETDKPQALNPALKRRHENVYDTKTSRAPIETTSVRGGGYNGWSIIWLVSAVLAIAVTIYLIV